MKSVLSLLTYTAAELAALVSGELHCFGCDGSVSFNAVATDSREVEEGTLFLAFAGERVDGHAYISAAAEAGASCVLAAHIPEIIPPRIAIVVVEDVLLALGKLARDYTHRAGGKMIAVTGSVGKTTTKEFISAVLGHTHRVHKTAGNHNNEIGLPMTLLATPDGTEATVAEMGMCGLGEIDYLSRIACPDIAIITPIGSSHLEQLGTRENICRAKLEITHGLKTDGILLCNGDEPLLFHEELEGRCPVFVGIRNRQADFRAVNLRHGVRGMTFDLLYGRHVVTNVEIPVPGQHNVYAALFAYAVGVMLGMSETEIRAGLAQFRNADMRQSICEIAGVTVIEDCYNASPESMRAALEVLSEMGTRNSGVRTAALLGDMRELGTDSVLMHHQLGISVAQHSIDYLFTLGESAEEIALGAIRTGMRADRVYVNPDCGRKDVSGEMLLKVLRPGDILLVKASRAVAAEEVVAYLRKNAARIGTENNGGGN